LNSPLQLFFGVFFIGVVAAAFAISFATIVYRGELAVFLNRGIGLTLLGTVIIGFVGAFTLSFRGSILGPQDVPAILLASGTATIVAQTTIAQDAIFATVACLIAVTSVTTGLLCLLMGRLRLAHVTRFFPYPVLAGFLATTGGLLFRSGLELTLGTSYGGTLTELFLAENMERWLVALVIAITICVATRLITRSYVC
jgi:SulP family sulfate permease